MEMFDSHKDERTYQLDPKAQKEVEALMEGYSEMLRQKYDLDNGMFIKDLSYINKLIYLYETYNKIGEQPIM